jgi:hypothetical protein
MAADGGAAPHNAWRHLVGDADAAAGAGSDAPPVRIHTDANIFVATVSQGRLGEDDEGGVTLELAAGRQAYLLALDGATLLRPSPPSQWVLVREMREDAVPRRYDTTRSLGSTINGTTQLDPHDAAELRGPLSLRGVPAPGSASAQCVMVEMQDDGSSRYTF